LQTGKVDRIPKTKNIYLNYLTHFSTQHYAWNIGFSFPSLSATSNGSLRGRQVCIKRRLLMDKILVVASRLLLLSLLLALPAIATAQTISPG
jgi:hypothetical protein